MRPTSVLFVCMGNICRSPVAEGVFCSLLEKEGMTDMFLVDSAGTHAYHVADAPDPRAQTTALERGIDISMLRARRVDAGDFEKFDHILVMDERNFEDIMKVCPRIFTYKIRCFLDFAPHLNTRNVPDPYYGGVYGFERVCDMVEDAAAGLLRELRSNNSAHP